VNPKPDIPLPIDYWNPDVDTDEQEWEITLAVVLVCVAFFSIGFFLGRLFA